MKKLSLIIGLLFALPLTAHQNVELDQFQWGMKNYLMILQKGLDLCNEQGYSFFKVEQCHMKSDDGKELTFKDVIRDESGERFEEVSSNQAYTIYLYREKPNDTSVVDVKKHNVLKKLAGNSPEKPASGCVKEIQTTEEFLHEVQTSTTPIYVKCYSPTCPPCSLLTPFFQNWASIHAEKGKFLSVDLSKLPAFRENYQIDVMPTLLVFDQKGEVTHRYIGLGNIGQFIDEKLNGE